MTDTSPYLKLDLLRLAQSIELERSMNERIRLENDWNAQMETARDRGETVPPFPVVSPVDHVRIIQVAQDLNNFVTKGV